MPLPLVRSLSYTCRGSERSSREVDVNVNFAALVLPCAPFYIFAGNRQSSAKEKENFKEK